VVVFAEIACFSPLLNLEKRRFFIKKFVFFGYLRNFFLTSVKRE